MHKQARPPPAAFKQAAHRPIRGPNSHKHPGLLLVPLLVRLPCINTCLPHRASSPPSKRTALQAANDLGTKPVRVELGPDLVLLGFWNIESGLTGARSALCNSWWVLLRAPSWRSELRDGRIGLGQRGGILWLPP